MAEKNVEQQLADAQALIKKLESERAEREAVIAEQHEQIKKAETEVDLMRSTSVTVRAAQAAGGVVVVTHQEVNYKVVAPKFSFDGTEYQAEELIDNKELVGALVEVGAGILVKI